MAKRLNYYSVHKNKKTKRLRREKPNILGLKSIIISMQSFSQYAIISSQNFNSMAEKSIAILENVKNHAEALRNLYTQESKQRYLKQKAPN
jgi:hypothetical protein